MASLTDIIGGLFGVNADQQQFSTAPTQNPYNNVEVGQTVSSPYYSGGTIYNNNTKTTYPQGQITPQAASIGPAPAPSGTSGPASSAPSVPSAEDRVRNDISGAYNSYFDSLNSMFAGLNDQKGAQEGVVNNVYNQGQTDLNAAQDQNNNIIEQQRGQTESNRTRNLQDIADNITNLMQSGNVFLGSRGAGDSSAANQYAYALTKLGTKERGQVNMNSDNILNDINTRQTNLRSVYTTELSRLNTTKSNQLLGIAQWYAGAQNQIKQLQADGKLGEGKDLASLSTQLLNYAINAANQVQNQTQAQQQQLNQWASTTQNQIQQSSQNINQIGAKTYDPVNAGPLNGSVSMSDGSVPITGFGGAPTQDTKDKNLFGLA